MDVQLIDRAKKGDHHAFRIIIETYKVHIYQVIYGVLRHSQDAEDTAQEAFLKIYDSLPQYKHQGFKTWVTRIAVNLAIDKQRQHRRRQEEVFGDDHLTRLITTSHQKSAEHVAIETARQHLIRQRMDELPTGYRDVVVGFYIHGKNYRQLAEEQHVKVKTIEMKLYRARLWMRKHWKEDDFL